MVAVDPSCGFSGKPVDFSLKSQPKGSQGFRRSPDAARRLERSWAAAAGCATDTARGRRPRLRLKLGNGWTSKRASGPPKNGVQSQRGCLNIRRRPTNMAQFQAAQGPQQLRPITKITAPTTWSLSGVSWKTEGDFWWVPWERECPRSSRSLFAIQLGRTTPPTPNRETDLFCPLHTLSFSNLAGEGIALLLRKLGPQNPLSHTQLLTSLKHLEIKGWPFGISPKLPQKGKPGFEQLSFGTFFGACPNVGLADFPHPQSPAPAAPGSARAHKKRGRW